MGMAAKMRPSFTLKECTVISKFKHSPRLTPVIDVWEGRGGNGSDENMLEELCVRDVWMGIPRQSWRDSAAATPPSLSPELRGSPPLLSQEEHSYL